MGPTPSRPSPTPKGPSHAARQATATAALPPPIVAALDALEACYPSYSASAAKARADVERAIWDALPATARAAPAPVLRLVAAARRR
ncbi:MAG: hypothetical protein ACJ79R_22135 [Anaeromyxobacteraceae bacterium]